MNMQAFEYSVPRNVCKKLKVPDIQYKTKGLITNLYQEIAYLVGKLSKHPNVVGSCYNNIPSNFSLS